MKHEGRNARGARQELLLRQAAADLLAEQGYGAMTHRALSARSGVPTTSTTHYFPTVDALVVAAAGELARRWHEQAVVTVEAVRRRPTSAAEAARVVAAVVLGPEPTASGLSAFYERYLQAGRVPALRPLVTGGDAQLRALVAEALDRGGRPTSPARARLLVATLDGLVLSALAEGVADPVAAATGPLADLLGDPA